MIFCYTLAFIDIAYGYRQKNPLITWSIIQIKNIEAYRFEAIILRLPIKTICLVLLSFYHVSACSSSTVSKKETISPIVEVPLGASKETESTAFNSLKVTATAYTSHRNQTDDTPTLAAWGDTLTPETKSIAVSRDLLPMGLTHNVKVEIKGLPGKFLVLDKMNKRWKKKIDIYMRLDIKAAKQWGKKEVVIRWPKKTSQ